METFGTLLSSTLSLFKTELALWGHTFSFWQVFAFTVVGGIVAWLLGEWFLGD